MTKKFTLLAILGGMTSLLYAQTCQVSAFATDYHITCGESVTLSAFGRGQGTIVFSENFNSGQAGTGWAFTQQARWDNPCSPSGVDGTTHVWFGDASPVPRELRTQPYNLTSATAGVTICFDMIFAEQGGTSPCEGPDEPDEGIYLQYSTNGTTWTDINYFDPNGGGDPQLINWNNWCFPLPAAAISANTQIRWFQDNDSGADYDHWGIDNVQIFYNDASYNIVWQHDGYNHGPTGGINPNVVRPRTDSTFVVVMSNGSTTCRDSVSISVHYPTATANVTQDTINVCAGQCATINGQANVLVHPADTLTFANNEFQIFPGVPLSPPTAININVQGLNMNTVQPNSILRICIDNLTFQGTSIFPPGPAGLNLLQLALVSPDGTRIILVPTNTTTGGSLTAGYNNTCFVPNGQVITTGTPPYTGNWLPNQPFSTFNGRTANGVWALEGSVPGALAFGIGTFFGWNITFADPEQSYQGDFSWTPTANLNPTSSLTPQVCPTIGENWYYLTVSDTAGCVEAMDSVLVRSSNCCSFTVAGNVTNVSCGSPNGAISINPSQADTYTYLWSSGATTQNLAGLTVGNYSVTVTNALSCEVIEAFNVIDIAPPFTIGTNVTAETCAGENDGTITVTTNPTGIYTYTWSHTSGLGNLAGNLPPVSYSITVTNGPCTAITTTTVPSGVSVTVEAGLNVTTTAGSTVLLSAMANPSTASLVWAGPGLSGSTNPASLVASQNATYFVTANQGPCTAVDSLLVFVVANGEIVFHNAFTPNGDQTNDTFYPQIPSGIDVESFEIYNRWGQLIHSAIGPWDGTFKNEMQPKDTYFFKLRTRFPEGEYHGDVTLIR